MAERGYATCPVRKRDVRTASGKLCTHNNSGSFELCTGSCTYFTPCGIPGMVRGEACVLSSGHDGAHLPMPVNARREAERSK